jgi:hypothetical protein
VSALLAALRSRAVRVAFVVLALSLAVWAVWRQREGMAPALASLPLWVSGLALLASYANVVLAATAWRAVVVDLGSRLRVLDGCRVFLVGQLGKYVPGSVWQVVASAEAGSGLGVPRRRTASALAVSMLVSVTTGVAVGLCALPFTTSRVGGRLLLAALALPMLGLLLHPRVTTSVLNRGLRLARRQPLDQPTSYRGTLTAAGLGATAWLAMGVQVFVLATALGAPADLATFALSTGGFAIAWVAGFLVVFAPAGVGVREVVLAAVMAGVLTGPQVLVLVLLSRVLLTVADVTLALAALWTMPRTTDVSVGR